MKKYIVTITAIIVLLIIAIFIHEPQPPQELTIGVLLPATGKFAYLSEDIQNSLEIARVDLENRNIKVNLLYEDTAGEPPKAVSAANKLIQVDKVDILMAGTGSSANLAVAPVAEQNKVPFIAISATPKLNDAGHYIFKSQPDIGDEVRVMVDWVAKQKYTKVAIMFDSTSDTLKSAKDEFTKMFTALGGEVVIAEGYTPGPDYKTQLTKIKDKGPEVVYVLGVDAVTAVVLKQANEVGLKAQFVGFSGAETQDFIDQTGTLGENFVISAVPFDCERTKTSEEFCDEYASRYAGRLPLQYGAYAYDILTLLGNEMPDSGVITYDLLEGASVEDSLVENFGFNSDGNIENVPILMKQLKDGKYEVAD